MEEVTLQAVLAARDARAAAQRRLLASWGRPLLSVTLNIAGPVKRWALTDFVFRDVLEALEDCLGADLLWKEQTEAVTGLEAVLVCGREAGALKDLAVELETARAAGRLYDLDVIAPDGCKLSGGRPGPAWSAEDRRPPAPGAGPTAWRPSAPPRRTFCAGARRRVWGTWRWKPLLRKSI